MQPPSPPDGASGRLRLELSWLAAELISAEPPGEQERDGEDPDRPLVLVGAGPAMAAYLRACLRSVYRVSAAPDPEALLDEALRQAPGLFILEEGPRGWNAFSLCDRLRADPRFQDVPVLVLIGEQQACLVPGEPCGAALLAQPFNAAEVQGRVAGLLAAAG